MCLVRDIKLSHKLIISSHMKTIDDFRSSKTHRIKYMCFVYTHTKNHSVYWCWYLWWIPIINVCVVNETTIRWLNANNRHDSMRKLSLMFDAQEQPYTTNQLKIPIESNAQSNHIFSSATWQCFKNIHSRHALLSPISFQSFSLFRSLARLLICSYGLIRFDLIFRCVVPIDVDIGMASKLHIQSTPSKLASWKYTTEWKENETVKLALPRNRREKLAR